MARIRSIKPGFFSSEDVQPLPLRARLTWIGLWTQCDDHGRTKDNARLIKAGVWPLDDVSLADVEQDLTELQDAGRILRYEVDGKQYLAVVNWHVHQVISKPTGPKHPSPPVPVNPTDPGAPGFCTHCSVPAPVALPDDSGSPPGGLPLGKEGKGKEGDARATLPPAPSRPPSGPSPEPPLRCLQHQGQVDSPACGACADARRRHQSWLAQQRARPTPTPSTPQCPVHPGEPTGSKACPRCTAEAAPAPDLRHLMETR